MNSVYFCLTNVNIFLLSFNFAFSLYIYATYGTTLNISSPHVRVGRRKEMKEESEQVAWTEIKKISHKRERVGGECRDEGVLLLRRLGRGFFTQRG